MGFINSSGGTMTGTLLLNFLPAGASDQAVTKNYVDALFAGITSVVTKTSNYTLTPSDNCVICDGTFTITLPSPVVPKIYIIKNGGTGVITVQGGGLIEGESSVQIGKGGSYTLQSIISSWKIV